MKKHLLSFAFVTATLMLNAQSGVDNLDFEYWTSGQPNGFIGFGVTQESTGAQHGNYYARISNSTLTDTSGIMIISNSSVTSVNNFRSILAGVPYTKRPVSLSGYYRSSLANPGEAVFIGAALGGNKKTAGVAQDTIRTSQSSWTPINLTFDYINSDTPDTLILLFVSNVTSVKSTSYLDIDNFSFNLTTGLESSSLLMNDIKIYPNPVSSQVTISSSHENATHFHVYDLTGRAMGKYDLIGQSSTIDLSAYEKGMYTYVITDENNTPLQKSKLSVIK